MINFLIDRPIFSSVIAIVITLTGGIAIFLLPIAQNPDIIPPQVQVQATYTGASSEIVANTVTTPLEQEINGIDDMIYISSNSTNDGQAYIDVTFDVGTDIDIAAADVLTRVNQANPQLPDEVQRSAVLIDKTSPDLTLVVSLFSPDNTYDNLYLSNYATISIIDVLNRIPGVGTITNFGERNYAIRVWLNPERLARLNMAAGDVVSAVQSQNVQVAAGKLGQLPSPASQAFQYQLTTLGRLTSPEEFGEIIVRTNEDGSVVRINDVGRVELGAENYNRTSFFSGRPSAQLGIFLAPGANALELREAVLARMEELKQDFPEGLDYGIIYDPTRFVTAAIEEVVLTLLEAIALVVLVVFVFLQKWRTTLIPCIAIPVALVGTFGVMLALGFSINTVTLLGLVLAVGLVVDDAIVVVENVERNLEEGLNPNAAAKQAMTEVTGPIVATTLVLFALFVPIAFLPGITGLLYNNFALTIAIAVTLSAVVSLSLTPSLCSLLLRKDEGQRFWAFRLFNRGFDRFTDGYGRSVGALSRAWYVVIAAFVAVVGATAALFLALPSSFLPEEDQGYFITAVQLPNAASLQRTIDVVRQVEGELRALPGVEGTVAIPGYNPVDEVNATYYGVIFAVLKPWDERTTPETQAEAMIATAQAKFATLPDARVQVLNPPPIRGLGSTGGLEFQIQDRIGQTPAALQEAADVFQAELQTRPEVARLFTTFSAEVPQFYLDVDRTKVRRVGVDMNVLFETIQVYLGSFYINDFNRFNRTFRVYVQAEQGSRNAVEDIPLLEVRNNEGRMVPLGTLLTVRPSAGPEIFPRYNLYPSAKFNISPAPGVSSGTALQVVQEVADQTLPQGFGYEWTGTAYQQQQAGNVAGIVFVLALLFVFLVLAAQYESWAMPFVIILAVPFALFGAVGFLTLRGLDLNVYSQVGLVMLIGLSAKNSILIVEFAAERRRAGMDLIAAAQEAARLRVRPILMTSFAFILGCVPLATSAGAGANARISIGTTVIGGMLVATFFTLYTVPTFFVLVERLTGRGERARREEDGLPAARPAE